MKLESPYDNSELASKVTFDCNKQLPSHILKLDDRSGKIEQDVIFDAQEGQVNQSIDSSQSNAYCLSSKSVSIKNRGNESDSSTARRPHATSDISLIAQEDLFYMDKIVTDVELPHLSISTKASPTVKDICIDEGAQMSEKILVEYDKADQPVSSNSNFSRVNGSNAHEEARENDVGETEFSSPSKCTTYLNETLDKIDKNDLRSLLGATGCPVEQFHSSNSASERKPLDATTINDACPLPSEEIFDERSHLLEEFNTDFSQMDSSGHGDGISENQDLRRKLEQVLEEEEILTTMVASSAEKSKESKLVVGTISGNKYQFEKEKTSEFVVSSKDTESNRIDDTNGASDDPKIDVAARNTSIAGSENEEPVSDGTTSARSSVSHLNHGDSNLLGPANFSSSVISSSHMPYSGNISLRSESSTTSGQSFAFPILQPEWSSSPVRMAKADRRHLRKHRWKTALTCCKF